MRSSREALPLLVLFGEENRENSGGLRRVAWVGRTELYVLVVVVEFPKVLFASVLDHSEVVFAVGVVVLGEVGKTSNQRDNLLKVMFLEAHEALRENHSAKHESLPCEIIECRDFSGLAA